MSTPVNSNDERFYESDWGLVIDESEWDDDELDEASDYVNENSLAGYISEQISKDD